MSNKFSDKEVTILKKCLKKYEPILNITASNKIKNDIWKQIEKEFNSNKDILIKRNYEVLQSKWYSMKYGSKRTNFASSSHSAFGYANFFNEIPSASLTANNYTLWSPDKTKNKFLEAQIVETKNNLIRMQKDNQSNTLNMASTSHEHSIFGGTKFFHVTSASSSSPNNSSNSCSANEKPEKASDILKKEIKKIENDKKAKVKELEEIEKSKKIQEDALLAIEVALIDRNTEYQIMLLKEERENKLGNIGNASDNGSTSMTIEIDPIILSADQDEEFE